MKNTLATLASLLVAGALLAGCGATRPSHYYQLSVVKEPLRPDVGSEQFPVTILVSTFLTSHLYREDRIVYGSGREEMGLYQYERWTEPPSEMLHEIIVRQLRGSGRYKEIYSMRSSVRGEYVLRGHLYDMKELATGNGLVARVTFEAELVDAKTRNTLSASGQCRRTYGSIATCKPASTTSPPASSNTSPRIRQSRPPPQPPARTSAI